MAFVNPTYTGPGLLERARRLPAWPVALAERATLRQIGASNRRGAAMAACFARLDAELPATEQALIAAVERERRALLRSSAPLADQSPVKPGPYDEGRSIRSVTRVSKSPRSALFLYHLIREFEPKTVIELGTNVGISAAYQAAALLANRRGHIVTLEASPHRLRLAQALHARLGLAQYVSYVEGLFADTLSAALEAHGPVDLAHIDGHHQYQPTLDYFAAIWPRSREGATFVFDDIRWSAGMLRAWRVLQDDERLGDTMDLGSVGVAFRADGDRRIAWPPVYSVLHPRDPFARLRFTRRSS